MLAGKANVPGGMPFPDLKLQLDAMYRQCCDHLPDTGNMIRLSDDTGKYLDKLIKQIYKNQERPDTDPTLLQAYGTKLGEAVAEGYGNKLEDIAWDTPDYQMLSSLQNNVWQFSAAKTDTQLRDMQRALIGPDGKLRSFEEFKHEAQQIVNTQLNWLRAEYNTVVAGSQMAAKWVNIQAQKDTFPLLEFDAVIDDHSSEICPPFNKVRLPVGHAFWTKFYPPNHFNCRSTVRQVRDGEITPDKDIQYPEKMMPLFKGNVGIDGGIFSDDHPYYKGTPAHNIKNATLYMPADEQYLTRYEAKDGTTVKVNRKTDIAQGGDLDNLIQIGKVLADKGKTVDILPDIHASETELRDLLLPGAKEGKNPDMLIDRDYTEAKKPSTPLSFQKLQRNIADAASQANRVIILLEEEYGTETLKKAALDRFKAVPDLEEIGFVTADGEYIEFLNDRGRQK